MHEGRTVLFQRLEGNLDLPVPEYATANSAGMDLRACLVEPILLQPGHRALVRTGFAVALPEGTEGQVRPRSGLAAKEGLTLLNSPGTIDPDYRGEIRVVVINLGQQAVRLERGDRIAQLVVAPLVRPRPQEAAELPATGRGAGGFGHTGKR
jgi:dUTP pyrophosphatase